MIYFLVYCLSRYELEMYWTPFERTQGKLRYREIEIFIELLRFSVPQCSITRPLNHYVKNVKGLPFSFPAISRTKAHCSSQT